MSVEANIALTRRWYDELWNRGNYDVVHELLAPNAHTHGQQDQPIVGPEAFIAFARQIHAAFPDHRIKIEEIFGVGDRVVVRWSSTATHRGDLPGIAATGRSVSFYGISIAQFKNGKCIEAWDCWDRAGLMQQLTAGAEVTATSEAAAMV